MEGKVAFVTGAGSGLGRAIAHRLAADGFEVAVTDIDDEAGTTVVKEITGDGGEASYHHCDVADLSSVQAATEAVLGERGSIDCLVNNAGFDDPDFFLRTDPASWQRLIAVDLIGVLNCTHAIAPHIAARCTDTGYGRIINIASDAGRVGSMGEAVYSAAKGGVIAFSKSMARELARQKVTVNAVCPGPADTPMTSEINERPIGAKMMSGMIAVTPFKRLAQPEEVASAVAYFAAEESRFVTGQVLSVSGGLTMSG
jgi:2-hydroxycyclohexanecarboxyl-CoA dehydrogenase